MSPRVARMTGEPFAELLRHPAPRARRAAGRGTATRRPRRHRPLRPAQTLKGPQCAWQEQGGVLPRWPSEGVQPAAADEMTVPSWGAHYDCRTVFSLHRHERWPSADHSFHTGLRCVPELRVGRRCSARGRRRRDRSAHLHRVRGPPGRTELSLPPQAGHAVLDSPADGGLAGTVRAAPAERGVHSGPASQVA